MPRRHLFITGKVQGVHFRESLRGQAQRLNTTGWVRNLPDGRVEAVLEGTEFALEQLEAWCRIGPSRARVRHVEAIQVPATGEDDGFRVIR